MTMKPRFVPPSVSRSARAYQCPRCHAYCMRGLDDDKLAGTAVVDSRPLNAIGELVALLEGRVTYDLAWRATRYEIDARYLEIIQSAPPGTYANVDVVCAHRCGKPIVHVAPLRRGGPRRSQVAASDDECPF